MSTYSPNLAIQLIATGDQAGQWGLTTNTNLGTLLEAAISGYVTQAFADANVVLPMPLGADGGNGSVANPVAARNMFITCSGTNTAQRSLFVPTNTKLYFISNQTTGGFGINVTTVGGSGVVVPNGQTALLVCDGINVKNAINFFPNLSAPVVINAPSSAVAALTTGGFPGNVSIGTASGAGIAVISDSNYGYYVTPTTTSLLPGFIARNSSSVRQLELLYAGGTSAGVYGAAANTSVINAQTGLTLSVNDLAALQISSSRNTIIPAPVSGVALNVNGVAGPMFVSQALQVTAPNTAGNSNGIRIFAGTNSTDSQLILTNAANTSNYWIFGGDGGLYSSTATNNGVGSISITGSVTTKASFSAIGQAGGNIQILPVGAGALLQSAFQYFTDNNLYIDAPITGTPAGGQIFFRSGLGAVALFISAERNAIFSAPSSGSAVTINGVAGSVTYALRVASPNSTGQSWGTWISAGTNTSDVCAVFTSASGTPYLGILGDGSVSVGNPTGGAKGLGSTNSVKSYINGDQIFSGVPPSSSTTISRADVNQCVVATGTITVPNNVFNEGDCVSVYNDSASSITLSAGITTMRLVGTSVTGSRTIAQRGMATIWFRSGTECVVSGGGVT